MKFPRIGFVAIVFGTIVLNNNLSIVNGSIASRRYRRTQIANAGTVGFGLPGGAGTGTETTGAFATGTLLSPLSLNEEEENSNYDMTMENNEELELVIPSDEEKENTKNDQNVEEVKEEKDDEKLAMETPSARKFIRRFLGSRMNNNNNHLHYDKINETPNLRRRAQLAPVGSVGFALPGGTGTGTATTGAFATSTLLAPFSVDEEEEETGQDYKEIEESDELQKVNVEGEAEGTKKHT